MLGGWGRGGSGVFRIKKALSGQAPARLVDGWLEVFRNDKGLQGGLLLL